MNGRDIRLAKMETPLKTKTICDVCKVLGDDKTMHLFLDGVSRGGLTRKQYYSRLSMLKEAGLITKKHDKYEMTSAGLVVKKALRIMNQAVNLNEMLRAYDVLRNDTKIKHSDIIYKLFEGDNNQEIRGILLTEQRVSVGADLSLTPAADDHDEHNNSEADYD